MSSPNNVHLFIKLDKILLLSIFFIFSCVDQLKIDSKIPDTYPISISGRITNKPGPYEVRIYRSYDIQSKEHLRVPVSAQRVIITDDIGSSEQLVETHDGQYQTSATGIQGRIGGIYKLSVEFEDGRVYESIPDTLLQPGVVDSVYHEFNWTHDYSGTTIYGFDVKFNARGNANAKAWYKWDMRATFKTFTHPEHAPGHCYAIPEEGIGCSFLAPCTGLRYVLGYPNPNNEPWRVGPCTCCTCWSDLFNQVPKLSDGMHVTNPKFTALNIYRIPLNPWYFTYKIRIEIAQSTLTKTVFDIFKSIRNQKEASGSLFQPVTGQIHSNLVQVAGEPLAVLGFFYAAGVSSKAIYLSGADIPSPIPVPKIDYNDPIIKESGIGNISCLELFPNSTGTKPDFWED